MVGGALLAALCLVAASCSFGGSSGSDQGDPVGQDTADSTPAGSSGDGSAENGSDPSTDGTSGSASTDGSSVFEGESGYSNDSASYLGNPIWVTGPGNIPVKADNEVAIRFVARYSGTTDRASFIIKYDFERPNYHGGDCGTLEVTLRPDANGVPAEDVLATMTFEDPCGGARDIGWLTDALWDAPASIDGGQTYHLVFTNTDPDPANFVSINMLYRPDDDARPLALSTGSGQMTILARGSQFWSGNSSDEWGQSADLIDHYPSFEIHYVDGTSQGVSYVGARFESEVYLEPDAQERIRQVFPVSSDTTIHSVWFRGVEASDDAAVVATLAEKDGAVLFNGPLDRGAGDQWFGARFNSALTLLAGTEYTLEVEATAGTVEVRPLYQADHDDWTSSEQSDWRDAFAEVAGPEGNWEPYINGLPHDLSLYFETGETQSATPTTTVAVYGDSLLNEPEFEQLLRVALDARGFDLVAKNSVSGRTTSELVAELRTEVVDANYYLINVGINGDESATEFDDALREALDLIYAANPDATILWSSLHALEGGVVDIVPDRVEPRNEVLDEEAAAGRFTLVNWRDVAAAHPEIYGSDGVHYFGNEQLYVQTMVSALDAALAAGR